MRRVAEVRQSGQSEERDGLLQLSLRLERRLLCAPDIVAARFQAQYRDLLTVECAENCLNGGKTFLTFFRAYQMVRSIRASDSAAQ